MSEIFVFEIYFYGLICIHGDSYQRKALRRRKVRAMMLDDVDHYPRLYVNDPDEIIDLNRNYDVRFENVGEDDAVALDSFKLLIPHLEDVTRYNVEGYFNAPSIKVTLPAGRIGVVDNYKWQAEYILDDKPVREKGCVGRLTMLQVRTVQPEVKIKANGQTVRVRSEGWVLVGNVEKSSPPRSQAKNGPTERPDFKKHVKATSGKDYEIATLYEDYQIDPPCMTPPDNPPDFQPRHLDVVLSIIDKLPVADHPECSNSQWP